MTLFHSLFIPVACRIRGNPASENCTLYNGTWFNETCYTVDGVGQYRYNYTLEEVNKSNFDSNSNDTKSPSDEYFQ